MKFVETRWLRVRGTLGPVRRYGSLSRLISDLKAKRIFASRK